MHDCEIIHKNVYNLAYDNICHQRTIIQHFTNWPIAAFFQLIMQTT
jgi:hypothetical protein